MKHFLFICTLFLCSPLAAQKSVAEPQTVKIPGSAVTFKMALLPAGTFLMGSPLTEPGRADDEGPQRSISLDSFWIGIHEVTYDAFIQYQLLQNDTDSTLAAGEAYRADAIARPSPPYYDFTYGRGKTGGFPATTMTQQGALRYCQWLSDKTGYLYRLPTEAEWEYACRAGTTTAYSFGNDPKQLDAYAWTYDNSAGSYQQVGTKKPNAWGLYDMHGNVAEWTLDFYAADYLQKINDSTTLYSHRIIQQQGSTIGNPWIVPAKKHSRTVRGGSFEDFAPECRSADRRKSEPKWQAKDPQIPKSKWWNPESWFVGFRIVRETRPYTKTERDAFFSKAIKD